MLYFFFIFLTSNVIKFSLVQNKFIACVVLFQSTLMRHSTPHPKELRSRYNRPMSSDRATGSSSVGSESGRASYTGTESLSGGGLLSSPTVVSSSRQVSAPDLVACSQQQQVSGLVSPLLEVNVGQHDTSLMV